jgi:hypothetical protein
VKGRGEGKKGRRGEVRKGERRKGATGVDNKNGSVAVDRFLMSVDDVVGGESRRSKREEERKRKCTPRSTQ